MKNKFEVFNDEFLSGVRTLIYFQKMRFPPSGAQPHSIQVGYSGIKLFRLHPDTECKILDARSGKKEILWRVMHVWNPMLGEVVEVLRGEPDLKTGRYRWAGTFRVGSVSVVLDECHVRLDPDPGSYHAS